LELVLPLIIDNVEFLAPAIKPYVALLAPTGEGEMVCKETSGVVTIGTYGS
jgi:hypothetical protein